MPKPRSSDSPLAPEHAGGRRPSDVSALLIELGRAVKARRFYPSDDPALGEMLDRSYRALCSELDRLGPLELEIREGGFRLLGTPVVIGRGHLDEFARELELRGVRRLRFERPLHDADFRTLVQILAADAERIARAGGIARALAPRIEHGICVNGVKLDGDPARAAARPRARPAADARGGADAPAPDAARRGAGTPPSRAPHDHGSTTPCELPSRRETMSTARATAPAADEAPAPPETWIEPARAPAREPEVAPAPIELDQSTEVERAADPGGELREHLVLLEACRGSDDYRPLARQVTLRAAALAEAGLHDDWYTALCLLSQHADRGSDREALERELALESVRELTGDRHLPDLIRLACDPDPAGSVRATQILLQLDARPVPELLRQIEAEGDRDRRARMNGILIAMGERATPALLKAIGSDDPSRARVGARLAGEIQNPLAVRALRGLLLSTSRVELRKEAAKALVRIGSTAIDVLVEALASRDPALAQLGAFCLGATGSPKAADALIGALRRAARSGDMPLAREVIRALGRLQRPEAVPELASILRQRSLLGRRRLRELKLAAAAALTHLPGVEAEGALRESARGGDAHVRRAARQALKRRQSGGLLL